MKDHLHLIWILPAFAVLFVIVAIGMTCWTVRWGLESAWKKLA